MRLIDVDALIYRLKPYAHKYDDDDELPYSFIYDSFIYEIKQEPTVDAVPVIRCKDCVHKSEYGYCTFYLNFHHFTEDMDYCSDAERKEHETD